MTMAEIVKFADEVFSKMPYDRVKYPYLKFQKHYIKITEWLQDKGYNVNLFTDFYVFLETNEYVSDAERFILEDDDDKEMDFNIFAVNFKEN